MSANNKALIAMIAVTAFVVGIAYNSARVEPAGDAAALLSAKLLEISKVEQTNSEVTVESKLSKLTLVNFWASWCAPCRQEMPIFETMYRANKNAGFQIVGVAIDSPSKAQPMLDSMDISYPILYAEQTGMTIMEAVGNPQGLLPYSLLLDDNGRVLEQVLGRIHEEQIQGWLSAHL